jgi:hypothetical protein
MDFRKNCVCCPENSCYIIYQTPLQALDFTSKLAAFCLLLSKTLNPAGGQIDFHPLSLSLCLSLSRYATHGNTDGSVFFQCHGLSLKCTLKFSYE